MRPTGAVLTRVRRRAAQAMVAMLALTAAACGSTVQLDGGQPVAGAPGSEGASLAVDDGLALSDGSAADLPAGGESFGMDGPSGAVAGGSVTAGGGTPTGSGDLDSGGATSGSPGQGGGGAEATGGRGSGAAAAGRGVTDKKILVGRFRYENAGAVNEAMGIAVPAPPTERMNKIMVDHLESQGGVAGRKVEIVYYTIDENGGQSASQHAQGACALWTQDRPVHSVLSVLASGNENLQACLAKSGVPHVGSRPDSVSDASTYRRFPAYFDISAYDLTRQGTAMVDGLARQGFFKPGPGEATGVKIGLVSFDDVIRRRAVDQQVLPALARHGLKLDDSHLFTPPNSEQETAQAAGEFPGVILRFKSQGINRVLFFADIGGGINIFFARTAESQEYYPRYGLTSTSFAQAAIDAGLVNARQYRGAVNVGWNPFADHGNRPKTTAYGPGFQRCRRIMNKGGLNFDGLDINAQMNALATCDSFFHFAAAVEAGAPTITASSFVAGVESLGTSFPAALSYRAAFSPGRHSGVAALRHSSYRENCQCFQYADKRFHSAG